MESQQIKIADVPFGAGAPLGLIAGPCVIESLDSSLRHAAEIRKVAEALGVGVIFKSSWDKANRTSGGSFRGPGRDEGLRILEEVRKATGLPILTDVHREEDVAAVAQVADVLQTPAFLCRQTDFILAVAASGKPANLKKGQFLSPWEMKHVVDKARTVDGAEILVTERGASFGYQNLVSDMRSLVVLRPIVFNCPVVPEVPLADNASLFPHWLGLRLPWASMDFFLRFTRIPRRHFLTVPPPGHSTSWRVCSASYVRLNRRFATHDDQARGHRRAGSEFGAPGSRYRDRGVAGGLEPIGRRICARR